VVCVQDGASDHADVIGFASYSTRLSFTKFFDINKILLSSMAIRKRPPGDKSRAVKLNLLSTGKVLDLLLKIQNQINNLATQENYKNKHILFQIKQRDLVSNRTYNSISIR
jgi:hypothetical protein